ncbi:MAG: hypothetical protein WDZ41_05255 [Candidatus Babeliales bacterium]
MKKNIKIFMLCLSFQTMLFSMQENNEKASLNKLKKSSLRFEIFLKSKELIEFELKKEKEILEIMKQEQQRRLEEHARLKQALEDILKNF